MRPFLFPVIGPERGEKMATNIYQSYERGTAKDRAELLYKNYCSFAGIIDACKARLIYEIRSEEQFCESHNRNGLGIHIIKPGQINDPTATEAINNVSLEEKIDGKELLALGRHIASDTQTRLKRKHQVLVAMREEYNVFDKYLYSLMPEEQRIIIPLLKHAKDYYQLASENGLTVETVRKRASRIHQSIITEMAACFIERI